MKSDWFSVATSRNVFLCFPCAAATVEPNASIAQTAIKSAAAWIPSLVRTLLALLSGAGV
jgi:hypothetical protein